MYFGEKIDGTRTSIALIDSCFDSSAKEFDGRVRRHIVIKKVDYNKRLAEVSVILSHKKKSKYIIN